MCVCVCVCVCVSECDLETSKESGLGQIRAVEPQGEKSHMYGMSETSPLLSLTHCSSEPYERNYHITSSQCNLLLLVYVPSIKGPCLVHC